MNWNRVADVFDVVLIVYSLIATFGWVGGYASAKSWRRVYKQTIGCDVKDD